MGAKNRIRSLGRVGGFSQGGNGLDAGVVPSDPDLVAANIALGVDVLGVTGTHVHTYVAGAFNLNSSPTFSNGTTYASYTKVFSAVMPYGGTADLRAVCSRDSGTQGYKWTVNGSTVEEMVVTGGGLSFSLSKSSASFLSGQEIALWKYNTSGTSTVSDVTIKATTIYPTITTV